VARGIVDKLVFRHPHVFGDETAADTQAVLSNWAKLKGEEKAQKAKAAKDAAAANGDGKEQAPLSALDGIPRSAPALLRATRAGEKAGAAGFDFADADQPRAKVDEELRELDEARARGDRGEMTRELGDALFALVNFGRKLGLDPESALRDATDRFARRFGYIESTLATQGRSVADADAAEQDRLWEAAKATERGAGKPIP
jgi:MazG family protein